MADTFIKRPVLYKGTKAQIESATMGENDFAVATDVEFYTKEEVNSLLGEGTTFEVQVVNSLPETGAKGVIYLVPKDGAAPDVHDEYVWIESTSTFELIGTTQIDLTGYVKNTDYASVSTGGAIKISNYYGSHIFGDGKIAAVSASLETYKSAPSEYFIGKATLENAKNDIVKRAITGNDIVLTDEEKTSAQTWLGVSGEYATQDAVSDIVTEMGNINNVLSEKANVDLDNITSVAKTKIVNAGQPDYSAGVSVSAATILAGYTAPSAGFLATSTGWLDLTVNGNNLPTGKYTFANNAVSLQQIFIPLNAGDVLVGTGGYQLDSNIFFPLKEI